MAEKRLNIKIGIDSSGTQAGISGIRKGLNLIGSAMKAVFRTAVVAGFFALMRVGVNLFNDFKRTVMGLGAEFLKLRLKATETAAIISRGGSGFTEAFEGALQMSRQLSTQIGFSTMQIQEGMITAARSGLGLQESLQITSSAMKLAQANGEEFQSTLNDLIGTTRAFGVELSDVPQFADALSMAVTSSNVSLNGLFEGLKNVASIASTAFGESKETIVDTTAALMVLNDSGIQSAKAGTRLRAAMQKLMGGTAKTTAVFTKYGANIFKSNAESQKYFATLTNGQKAMAGAEEKLNKLKNRQFELVIANRESSDEYRQVQDEINSTTNTLSNLEEGLDNVYEQFTLAGGKLKPLSDVLSELKKNVPTEVIGRAFGIRGGEAIMRLLKDTEKFNTFKDSVQEAMDASEKGVSITDNMYVKFLDTILVGWQRIQNTALSTWAIIADGLFEAIKPILPKIQQGLTFIFEAVSKHKGDFKELFEAALQPLSKIFDKFVEFSKLLATAFTDVFTEGAVANIPTLVYNKKSKQLEQGNKEVSGTISEKFAKILESLGDALVSILQAGVKSLEQPILELSKIFANGFADIMAAKVELWKSIGTYIGGSILSGMGKGAITGLTGGEYAAKGEKSTDVSFMLKNWMRKLFGATPLETTPTSSSQSNIGGSISKKSDSMIKAENYLKTITAKSEDSLTNSANEINKATTGYLNGIKINLKTMEPVLENTKQSTESLNQISDTYSKNSQATLNAILNLKSVVDTHSRRLSQLT